VHATLILTAPEPPSLLGMSVLLRVALAFRDAGMTSLSLHGERAPQLSAALAGDSRLGVPVRVHAPNEVWDWVCRADTLFAPRLLRALAPGDIVKDARGVTLAVRLSASRSDPAVTLSAAEGPMHPIAAPDYAYCLSERAEYRAAEQMLLADLIKPSDGPVSRHLNRRLSRAITRLLLPLGMTPNQVTLLVLATGLGGAYSASFPAHRFQLLGAALYQLHSIIDGCDGEIARLTHRFGKHGALIDSLVDDVCNGAFFVGLSLGVAHARAVEWPLVTGAITAGAYVGLIALQYGVVLRSTGRGDKTKFWAPPASSNSLFGLLRVLLRRDVFVLLILCAVAIGLAPVVVAVFPVSALGALLASYLRVLRLRKPA
jgi:phosphatidylglycerophosphate synthase